MDLLVSALGSYKEGNIIVYAPTIAKVEKTADFLQGMGIPAIAYHGQMEADERRRNQERWMSDEVRVLVGTIAFGLGINKAAVRAVIHLSLPKSIEQYYQEAGRAGRDGLPADCVLLWQKRDAGLHAYFIGQIADPGEKERAWQRYHEIRGFVESRTCRHLQICTHFGETPKWKTCEVCDLCGYEPDWLSVREEVPTKKSRSEHQGARPARSSKSSRESAAPGVDPSAARISSRVAQGNGERAERSRVRGDARYDSPTKSAVSARARNPTFSAFPALANAKRSYQTAPKP